MQTNILHSVKVLKQESHDALYHSPKVLALEALLYVRIDYLDRPCRSAMRHDCSVPVEKHNSVNREY